MFEAVGYEHYDAYFGACDRLLKPHGSMLLQTITIEEAKFGQYRRQSDWIKKHIFPGRNLPPSRNTSFAHPNQPLTGISFGRHGMHYPFTLRASCRRFWRNLPEVKRLGFEVRFISVWDYHLA